MLKAQRSIKIAEIDKPEHKAITLNKRKGKVRRRTVPTPGAPTRVCLGARVGGGGGGLAGAQS